VELSESSDVEAEKVLLHEAGPGGGGRLALVIVGDTAVQKTDPEGEFGTYEMFIRGKLDQRIISEIRNGVRSAIVDARIAATGLDRERIEELTHVARVRPVTVTEAGETKSYEGAQVFIPMGFMILLLVSVFTGGQYLMTSTIEEKSSRVVEILLSAVSPMQLMAGKILGQMVVGMLIIGLYAGMGISALVSFALLGLLEWHLLLYLILFYLISYFVVGSLMAAIGAAVNEPREAQSFMMPIMLIMMVPWMLWFPISRDPNSVFATIASFTPPINTFVMLMRMSSTTPPPWWQVWVSILIGVASVYAALWFAAKVFRVGLLLHGKPPNFRTLLRWVRQS
jgi:ABC-2 type transport system permease protein